MPLKAAIVALAASALLLPAAAPALPLPGAPTCPVFPVDNAWNRRVDTLPVASNSSAIVDAIGADIGLHPDFGSGTWNGGPIGIPITVVGSGTPTYQVPFRWPGESDAGPYPIPAGVAIEGGPSSNGDRHALVVDRDACRLYELYRLFPTSSGWKADSGAIWDLRSNQLRPEGWTSADAAGLPILPGLARYDEVARGVIDHALRFTVQYTRRAYVFPARHFASDLTDPNLPPMGLRVRLKAAFDTTGYGAQSRVVLEALKRYGMMVADNGSDWYVSGAPDPGWDDDDLHALGGVKGSDFEVVDTSSFAPPTAVSLSSFSALRTARGVAVRWSTATEVGLLGFVVHRQDRSRRTRVSGLIRARGASAGSRYRFVDRRAAARGYALEVFSVDGRRIWLGPVAPSPA